jgi:enoyl-CoA hydratase/3-hydroxyacyl-CoA dehydrogenase
VDLERRADGVAVVYLRNPPVNALHPALLRDLASTMQELQASADVKAVVIAGAGNKAFSAGFDISQFAKGPKGESFGDVNAVLTALLENGDKPTVAAVRGVALGGGCEVALACNGRVCTPKSKFGLPELQLGIIPGFGGTQRLPRLVGLEQGIKMILTSKPINAKAAKKNGLVVEVVPDDKLLEAACKAALEMAAGRLKRERALQKKDKLPPKPMIPYAFHMAKEQIKAKAPNLQHPVLCLDAMMAGLQNGGEAGLRAEAEAFQAAAALPTHKALVHVFFASRGTKKVRGVTDQGLKPRPVKTVAILGGGLMGSGIATASLQAGIRVVLKEINQKFLQAGMARVAANFESKVKKGRMSQEQMDKLMSGLTGTLEYGPEFAQVDMVVEAAVENLEIKQRIFADLEQACRPDCVLSTNTSTIDITLVGAKMREPARVVGAHFFSPAHVMPLLEIIRETGGRGPPSPAQSLLDTVGYASALKKTPVVVGNCTGFAVNRVFFPYTMSATLLLEAGCDPYRMDQVIKGWGMPMGPFRLCDLVGMDISMHVGANFVRDFPERVYISRIVVKMNEAGRLGEKSKAGFYDHQGRGKATPAQAVGPIVQASRQEAGLGDRAGGFSDADIVEALFFPVVNEGCRVIAEGIVDKPADLDIATVMSMGFPPYRGGLIHWADHMGARRIVARLQEWERAFPEAAGFFKPCDYLLSCAEAGVPLSQGAQVNAAPQARL